MTDRPTCSRCSKSIATEVSKCGESQCLNTFHPRCSYLFTRTASAPECCKIAFPYGRQSQSAVKNRAARKNQVASNSRAERARLFDNDRDRNTNPLQSPDRSQLIPSSSDRLSSHQYVANSNPHLPLAHQHSQHSQHYVPNPFLHQPPMGQQTHGPGLFQTTPHSNRHSTAMSRPSLAMSLPTSDLSHNAQIVHPDTWANLSPSEQQSAMYSCMYSCLMSNQKMQSQMSAINERVATAEGNASTALNVASSTKHTVSTVQDEVVLLRSEVKELREAAAARQQNAATNSTWSSSILISGIPSAAGTNYEEIAHLIFTAIGAQKFISDITSATPREQQHKPMPASSGTSTNQDDMENAEVAQIPTAENIRTPRATATSNASRKYSILVRLKSPMVRFEIIQLKVAHNGGMLFCKDLFPNLQVRSDAKIFINEWLPPQTFKLLKLARSKLKTFYAIWVRDGQVFARKDVNAPRIALTSTNDIDRLVS